jgi:xanthine dehydrogenase large subunit
MKADDRILHVRGESVFVDDIPSPAGCLEAAVLGSPAAHGRITRLDTAAALAVEGVAAVLTAADIPGENQTGTIILDEPALADGEVHCVGQPVAVVLAESVAVARRARALIVLEIEPLPAVLDPREAAAQGRHIIPPRTFACGDVDAAWGQCAHVESGRADSGGQEHFYLETQSALAVPGESGTMRVHSATQAPTATQKVVARVLGLPMHAVEVDVRRLGGGFGGKEEQATPWAVYAALGAQKLGRPVRLVLDRADDMRMTGKRHPYSSDWRLGLDADGRILAWEVTYYQDAGATADLSTAILERTLFHSTGSYAVPNVRATAHCCRTNVFPNTAYRGFGGPQAMFVMETALARAAAATGRPLHELQRLNLLDEGDRFPYGMVAEDCRARRCWDAADKAFDFAARVAAAAVANRGDDRFVRGVAAMPVCFGISFTNTALNQAGALVHVYQDGSVGVSTGAVEMGQGINRKIRRVVARTLGVAEERVRIETANTLRVANTSPTAASTGADLNGEAARLAAAQIAERLRGVAARRLGAAPDHLTIHDGGVHERGRPTALGWDELVDAAYWSRTNLSAHAHYATPNLAFDRAKEKGTPFAYHVYGVALTEVVLDRLLGTFRIESVQIVHDTGSSLDRATDVGQVEGALAQGLGWMLMEELSWDDAGRLVTDSAGKYKVPDLDFMPRTLEVRFLEDPNPRAVMGSKAVGEPPFMYGIGGFLALAQALRAARPDLATPAAAPLTPEKTLMHLAAPSAPETKP